MADSRIFGRTTELMGNALKVSARRHNLITSNVANMDTIGFKPSDLDFNRTLNRLMGEKEPEFLDRTHSRHLSSGTDDPDPMTAASSEELDLYHLDSVNIDTEMMNLMENNLKYRLTTEMLLRKMKILHYSIDEGGK